MQHSNKINNASLVVLKVALKYLTLFHLNIVINEVSKITYFKIYFRTRWWHWNSRNDV